MGKKNDLLKDYHEFLGTIDFSKVKAQTKGSPKYLAEKVGLYLIDKAINRVLHNYTDQYFFEYSLLPSAINPKTGKLLSFAGVRTEDPLFEQNVGKYVGPIINTLYPSSTNRAKGYTADQKVELLATNWFHNPEMFLFPTINKVEPFYIPGNDDYSESNKYSIISVAGNSQSSFRETDETNLYFANLSYPRTIDEMLGASKIIIQKIKENKDSDQYPLDKLLSAYHEGASRLKAHYDHYFVTDAGQYDYITFPVLSTSNDNIGHFYSNFFLDAIPQDVRGQGHVAGMGHFFLYLRNTKNRPISPNVRNDLFLEINKILSHIALNYIYSTGIELMENMRKVAVKAAIAQVMVRNMSHNFGSHVLSNLIGPKTYEMVKDGNMDPANSESLFESNIKYGYNSFYEDNQSTPVFKNSKDKNYQLPAFFQYLKSRMDYLNEVTFSVTTFVTTRLVREDVMKELDRVRILLNTISGVGDFRYSFHLLHNGERIKKENDFRAAFPADILGCQAFYNIIENIIRNTAKHAMVPEGKEVVFTIEFKDKFDTPEFKGLTTSIPELDDYYLVEIYSDVLDENIDTLVENQKHEINRSVLDENNNLRSRSLGLLEMEASAAFLRQMDLTEIESDDYVVDNNDELFHEREGNKRLNILKPFAIDRLRCVRIDPDGNSVTCYSGKLGYRFFVQKPKDYLFVGEWTLSKNEGKDKAIKDRLFDKGVKFLPTKTFLSNLKSGTSYPHPFVILNNVSNNLAPYRALLSLRQIHVSTEEKKTLLAVLKKEKSFDPGAFKKALDTEIWKLYGQKTSLPEPDKITIETNINHRVLNANWVIFTRHPFVTAFNKLLNGRDLRGYHLWREGVSSLKQGKLPEFGTLSSTGRGEDALSRYAVNVCKDPAVKMAIFEAYDHPVIIIDERVQRFAEENRESGLPCWALHQSTNVFIPRRPAKDDQGRPIDPPIMDTLPFSKEDVISLDPNDFTEDIISALLNYINRQLKNKESRRPSLLIHYGILERMFKGETEVIRRQLNMWAKKAQRVVVTSGRGAHSISLPDTVCFVNLSSVLYACNENRNKYLIYNLINQSRKKTQ